MYLTKKQSLTVALGTLAAFFGGGIAYVKLTRPAPPPTENAAAVPSIPAAPTAAGAPAAAPAEGSNFVLNDFHRSEMKDGKKLWEVSAKKGQYFPETNTARLEDAMLFFYRPSGEVVQMSAAAATLRLAGTSLTRAEISGGVTLIYGEKVTVRTEEAIYEREKNLVSAPGEVSISSEQLDIVGRELTAKLDKNEVKLAKSVMSTVKQRSLRRGNDA